MSGFLVDKETGSCPCGRSCCTNSACCIGFGRSCGNGVRSTPWASICGLLLTFVGAGFAFKGLDEFQVAIKFPKTSLEIQDYYTWLVVGIWAMALVGLIMFIQGVFSTGKPREYCCRQTLGRRRGKCSCRAVCRASAGCTFTASWFLMLILVVATFAFACATGAAFTAKKIVDISCVNIGPCSTAADCGVAGGHVTAEFSMDLTEFSLGPDLNNACKVACKLCDPLNGTDEALLKFWWGSVAILTGMLFFMMATTSNSLAVRQERFVARPVSQAKGGDANDDSGFMMTANPVQPGGRAHVEVGDWA